MISLAPMEGITTYVYRNALNRHFGGVDKYYTPFLTASNIKGREKRDVDPANNDVPARVAVKERNNTRLFFMLLPFFAFKYQPIKHRDHGNAN